MAIKLKHLLEISNNNEEEISEEFLFSWQIPVQENLDERDVNYAFVKPSASRKALKSQLEIALDKVEEEYNKIMGMFYYFDDKSLGTISEKVLASLLEKTGVFKKGTVSQTGGSNGLSDLEIDGQGISLKTTQFDKAIGVGVASGEGGVLPGDAVVPNEYYFNKNETPGARIAINKIPKSASIKTPKGKTKSVKDSIKRRVDAISMKLGNDLFLWAGIRRSSDKKLSGFSFYLLDINGQKLSDDIMEKGEIVLSDKTYSITYQGTTFANADSGQKYLSVTPNWIKKQIDATDEELKSKKSGDTTIGASKGSKTSVTTNPKKAKKAKFDFNATSNQVFNAMLTVLTQPKNMEFIVKSVPLD